MGAQRIPAPITVEQYARIPAPSGGCYELHHGELVFVTRPVRRHWDLQRHLRKLLETECEPCGFIVGTEYAYRPFPEHEVWGADVACVSEGRHQAVADWLLGSPELVIEVKSPSNTKIELHDKAMTTLAGEGALQFWIVDPPTQSVTVHSKAGMSIYRPGDSVPLPIGNGTLAVSDILAGLA